MAAFSSCEQINPPADSGGEAQISQEDSSGEENNNH